LSFYFGKMIPRVFCSSFLSKWNWKHLDESWGIMRVTLLFFEKCEIP
jgi:hypothetical protein